MASSGEVDIGSLTDVQQQALQQYTSVTGQEIGEAVPLLQRSQWNVQIAITKFFDGEQADPVAEALATQNATPQRVSRHENLQESLLMGTSPFAQTSRQSNRPDEAPRIVPQPEDQVARRPPFIFALLFTPLEIIYRILSLPFSLFARLFPFLPRLFGPSSTGRTRQTRDTSGRRPLNPRDTMARYKREFEEEFGPHSLPFVDSGYAHALDLAKKELKFLLVILSSPEHDDTVSFTRDTLLSPEVAAFLNDPANNIIVWAGNVLDSEAYQVSTALKCTKFPSSALITHTPREGSTAMSVVGRLAGPMPASAYINKLKAAISSYTGPLEAARASRAAQDFDRNIRQEQDSAYERSLAQDRERTRQRKEAEAAQAAAEKKALEDAEAAEAYAANLESWKRWRSQAIEPEPAASDKDGVRIGLRMPGTAERITRRFRSDAGIEELYAFVECYDTLEQASSDGPFVAPKGFAHTYGFQLVSPMPRTVYSVEGGGTIGERVGRSGNLIVEPLVGEDEDEGEDEEEE